MYLVFDLETESKEVHKRKGNPWHNRILCSGRKYQNNRLYADAFDYMPKGWLTDVKVLVGHNIKYDLLHTWSNQELQDSLKNGATIWCTQLTEYILSGQQHKYPGLRDIAVNKYGCVYRDKNLEKYKINGQLDTTLIPIKELLQDVRNDVIDTEAVMRQQVKLAKENGMYNLCRAQMDALLATTEMEANGMYINQEIFRRNKEELQKEVREIEEQIDSIGKQYFDDFNPNSTQQISLLFFGGSYEVTERVQVAYYKNGNPKYANIDKLITVKGLGLTPLKSWATKKEGIYQTNESVLKLIAKKEDTEAGKVANLLLKSRGLNKLLSTYYESFESLIYAHDSCVHAELCHCGYERNDSEFGGGTSTGRLSSRNPNIQNIPRAGDNKVKHHFTSRFGDDGVILEFDYSQLEVCVFAFLTQDVQLLSDIREGRDIHTVLAKQLWQVDEITKEQRQQIKPCTFHVIYGGGYKSLAKRQSLDEEFCKKFIETFYERYPMAKQWQDSLVKMVEGTRFLNGKITTLGHPQHDGIYTSITGRKYVFSTTDSPKFLIDKGVLTSFNPPDIKNYPVQGLATADIVLCMIGRLWRNSIIIRKGITKFLLINTIHDSIVVDSRKDSLLENIEFIKSQLEDVKSMMKECFNIDFNVPVKVDYKQGRSWGECE